MRRVGQKHEEAAEELDPIAEGQGDHSSESKTKECQRHGGGNECCRTFFASPVWKCFTLTVVGFTPVFGVVLAMPEMLKFWRVEPWTPSWLVNYCFAAWLATQFIYNFAATQWTDAGGCKSIKPTEEVTGQFQMGGKDSGLDLLYAPNWCAKCSHWKPPRSHHCSTSGRCVFRMDHFCPWTGNCIGARNHGHFILFYFFAVIGLTYSLILSLGAAYSTNHISKWQEFAVPHFQDKEMQALLKTHFMTGCVAIAVQVLSEVGTKKGPAVLVQLVATSLAFIPVLGTGCPACLMAWSNITTMEKLFPLKEYVQLKEKVYCPLGPGFYRLSGLENLKTIMGKRWWRRLILPVPGDLDMDLLLMPPPSTEGIAALKERIQQVKENGVKQEVQNCKDLGFDPGPNSGQSV